MQRRDRTTEVLDVLCDLTLSPRQALVDGQKILRQSGMLRRNDINSAFIMHTGWVCRQAKAESRFNDDQLRRWADDGGFIEEER